jgi:hypothetical protein
MYRPFAYFWGKILPDLPQRLLPSLVFGLTSYFMIGFRSGIGHVMVFLLIFFLNIMVSYSLTLFVSSFAKNFAIANILTPLFIVLMMLPSGFLINLDNLPPYWVWIKYISFFKYVFEALMDNEFNNQAFTCTTDEYKPDGCTVGAVDCICPVTNGNEVLTGLGFGINVIWRNVVVIVGMCTILLSGAFLCLKYLQKEKR